jgi:hypothetical protein
MAADLLFCHHHYNKHEGALHNQAIAITDKDGALQTTLYDPWS